MFPDWLGFPEGMNCKIIFIVKKVILIVYDIRFGHKNIRTKDFFNLHWFTIDIMFWWCKVTTEKRGKYAIMYNLNYSRAERRKIVDSWKLKIESCAHAESAEMRRFFWTEKTYFNHLPTSWYSSFSRNRRRVVALAGFLNHLVASCFLTEWQNEHKANAMKINKK